MGTALRYWRLVTLGADGKQRQQEIPVLKTFWQQQFPELVDPERVPDLAIQRQLTPLRKPIPRRKALRFWQNAAYAASSPIRLNAPAIN
jgi:hypothetical protein